MINSKKTFLMSTQATQKPIGSIGRGWHRFWLERKIKSAARRGLYNIDYFTIFKSAKLEKLFEELREELVSMGYRATCRHSPSTSGIFVSWE